MCHGTVDRLTLERHPITTKTASAEDRPVPGAAAAPRRLAAALLGAYRRLDRGRQAAPGERVWTQPMTAWLLAGLALALAVSLADGAAIEYARRSQSATIRVMAWITDIGKSQWYLVPAAIVFCAVGLSDWPRAEARGKVWRARLFGHAAYIFAAVALSGTFVNVVKVMFGRARPKLMDAVGPHHFEPFTFGYLNASFPSGHSTTIGALTGILMIWYPRWSILIVELGLFVAATRIAAGAHYPSDVVTGFVIGAFFSIVLARWLAGRGVVFKTLPRRVLPMPLRAATPGTGKARR